MGEIVEALEQLTEVLKEQNKQLKDIEDTLSGLYPPDGYYSDIIDKLSDIDRDLDRLYTVI